MTRFSFVHASDLHLDSPFAGVTATAPEVAERLRTATFDAFDNIVRLCIERRVDFLLVAGDVYDGADRSLRAQLRFRDGLLRLAEQGIRAFVAHGNHDALEGWSSAIEWPEGVRVFGEELASVPVERDGAPIALVSGISYPEIPRGCRGKRARSDTWRSVNEPICTDYPPSTGRLSSSWRTGHSTARASAISTPRTCCRRPASV
jgi:DNA repair exonuclease SbcCD nuclease subunit